MAAQKRARPGGAAQPIHGPPQRKRLKKQPPPPEAASESDEGDALDAADAGLAEGGGASREHCTQVEKVTSVGAGGKASAMWHCRGCGRVFEDKASERKHAYRTNLWLRRHGRQSGGAARTGGTGASGGGSTGSREGEGAAVDGTKKRGPLRGRRGGAKYAKRGEACRDWEQGKCARGAACRFLHGAAEDAGGGPGAAGGGAGAAGGGAGAAGGGAEGHALRAGRRKKAEAGKKRTARLGPGLLAQSKDGTVEGAARAGKKAGTPRAGSQALTRGKQVADEDGAALEGVVKKAGAKMRRRSRVDETADRPSDGVNGQSSGSKKSRKGEGGGAGKATARRKKDERPLDLRLLTGPLQ